MVEGKDSFPPLQSGDQERMTRVLFAPEASDGILGKLTKVREKKQFLTSQHSQICIYSAQSREEGKNGFVHSFPDSD